MELEMVANVSDGLAGIQLPGMRDISLTGFWKEGKLSMGCPGDGDDDDDDDDDDDGGGGPGGGGDDDDDDDDDEC